VVARRANASREQTRSTRVSAAAPGGRATAAGPRARLNGRPFRPARSAPFRSCRYGRSRTTPRRIRPFSRCSCALSTPRPSATYDPAAERHVIIVGRRARRDTSPLLLLVEASATCRVRCHELDDRSVHPDLSRAGASHATRRWPRGRDGGRARDRASPRAPKRRSAQAASGAAGSRGVVPERCSGALRAAATRRCVTPLWRVTTAARRARRPLGVVAFAGVFEVMRCVLAMLTIPRPGGR
jgi:hypothetical protein